MFPPDSLNAFLEEEPFPDESVERLALLAAEELEAPVNWKRVQSQDRFCAEMIAYLTARRQAAVKLSPDNADIIVRIAHDYVLDNGVLYRFAITTNGRQFHKVTAVRPVVVPVALRAAILAEIHDSKWSGGHLGQHATYAKLQQRVTGPQWEKTWWTT